jgi:ribonuclease HII
MEITNDTNLQLTSLNKKKIHVPLKKCYDENPDIFEIGVDEVGRGPLFGRVYTAAVILPKDDSFNHSLMKDSKRFTSKKKIEEVSNYIKENSLGWYVSFEEENIIDEINILQATQSSMRKSILKLKDIMIQKTTTEPKLKLLIDGNYFNPIATFNKTRNTLDVIPHICIEGGDNKYSSIAAASILAKVTRDKYIYDLCIEHPDLIDKYAIDSNKGYGSKKHIDGIKQHGITKWHRKSFGICNKYK